jgi:hypothetical protein
VPLAEDQHPVGALGVDCQHEAFGEAVMIIPTLDLADLLGCRSSAALPELPLGLEAVESLDDALYLLEMQALARALQPFERKRAERWIPTYILIAMTSRYDLTRLQVVLELGAGYGVAGLLLGHWWPGVTVSVQADGRAGPASPGLSISCAAYRSAASTPPMPRAFSPASESMNRGSRCRPSDRAIRAAHAPDC